MSTEMDTGSREVNIGDILKRNIDRYDLRVDDADVCTIICKTAVLGYLRMIITEMVQLKHNDAGDGIYNNSTFLFTHSTHTREERDNKVEMYDESPYTAEDLYVCFKNMFARFPNRIIYDVAIRHILENKNKKKVEEVPMMVDDLDLLDVGLSAEEDDAYLLEDLTDYS